MIYGALKCTFRHRRRTFCLIKTSSLRCTIPPLRVNMVKCKSCFCAVFKDRIYSTPVGKHHYMLGPFHTCPQPEICNGYMLQNSHMDIHACCLIIRSTAHVLPSLVRCRALRCTKLTGIIPQTIHLLVCLWVPLLWQQHQPLLPRHLL